MAITVTPQEVREARSFLHKRGLKTSDVAPRDLATLSKRFSKSLSDALKLVASLKMKGQGGTPYEKTKRTLIEIEEAK